MEGDDNEIKEMKERGSRSGRKMERGHWVGGIVREANILSVASL